jgi:hypothetical protein
MTVDSLIHNLKKAIRLWYQEEFQSVLRAAVETEIMQENIQDWPERIELNPGFQLLTEEGIASLILFVYFQQHCLNLESNGF